MSNEMHGYQSPAGLVEEIDLTMSSVNRHVPVFSVYIQSKLQAMLIL